MKKIYSLVAMALAAPALFAATDYAPAAPSNVEYLTHRIQSRTLRDADDDKVSYSGEFDYAKNEWGEFQVENPLEGKITLTVTNTYADGHAGTINNSRLSYRILVRKVGQTQEEAQPLIFDAANGYIKWDPERFPDTYEKEPLEWVDNGFSDGAQGITTSAGASGTTEPNVHVIAYYGNPADVVQIGVQSRHTRSKVEYDGPIAWVDPTEPNTDNCLTWAQWVALNKQYNPNYVDPYEGKDFVTAVEEVKAEAVGVEYYDLQGNKMAAGQKGLQIKLTRMSDGSVKATKVIR